LRECGRDGVVVTGFASALVGSLRLGIGFAVPVSGLLAYGAAVAALLTPGVNALALMTSFAVVGLCAFVVATLGFALSTLVLLFVGDLMVWLIEGRRPRVSAWLADEGAANTSPGVRLRDELLSIARYYVTGESSASLTTWLPPLTRATWPRFVMLLSVTVASVFAIVELTCAAEVTLLQTLRPWYIAPALVVHIPEWIAAAMPGPFFLLSSLVIALTCLGLLLVPRRGSADYTLTVLTYLVVGTFWYAALYQSGSAAGILTFAVRDGADESLHVLGVFDSLYFAVGTIVTAGGSGITPVSELTRAFVTGQFVVLGIVVYWLFQRRPERAAVQLSSLSPAAPAVASNAATADAPIVEEQASRPPEGLSFVWNEGVRLIDGQLRAASELDTKIGRLLALVSAGLAATLGVLVTGASIAANPLFGLGAIGLAVVMVFLVFAFHLQGFAYAPALSNLVEWANAPAPRIQEAFLANLEQAYLDNLDAYSIKGLFLQAAELALLATGLLSLALILVVA
jgi:hypothetical protein